MRLNVDLSALVIARSKITSEVSSIDLGYARQTPLDPLDVSLGGEGIEITDLGELDHTAGLLSYQGRQILLYIPDHSSWAGDVLDGLKDGNKFHVSDCRTLQRMRANQRYDRYKVANNIDARFHISGTRGNRGPAVEGEVSLKICRDCLRNLNYRGYANRSKQRQDAIVEGFSLARFFSHYSTVFRHLPQALTDEQRAGYSNDWPEVSRRERERAGYCCDECHVVLRDAPHLLHVHHLNGVRGDNHQNNLRPLCADCHRKQPQHGHMRPPRYRDMQTLTRLRREQGLLESDNWRDVWTIADTAVAGVLDRAKHVGLEAPEIGFEVTDGRQAVCGELEAAWPRRKVGLYIAEPPAECPSGWQLFSLREATEDWQSMAAALGC